MKLRLFSIAIAALLAAPNLGLAVEQLSQADVELIIAQAATRAQEIAPNAVIAVTDREGFVLAIWSVGNTVPQQLPAAGPAVPLLYLAQPPAAFLAVVRLYAYVGAAITRASTAAFLSSGGEAFTTRTAGYIIQQHFPVGIADTPNGPLVGVGFSSLFFTDVNRVKLIPPGFDGAAPVDPTTSPGVNAPPYLLTSLDDSPGGVPLYKNGEVVGGVGVTGGDGAPTNLLPAGAIFFKQGNKNFTTGFQSGPSVNENVALGAQTNYRPPSFITANNVLINGIRLPYTESNETNSDINNPAPLGQIGHQVDVPLAGVTADPKLQTAFASGFPQASPAPYPYQPATLAGNPGEIRFPFRTDPVASIPGRETIRGAKRLNAGEVQAIIELAAQRALHTRAGIRQPVGSPAAVFISVVNNPDKAGEAPAILGIFRTQDATVFSLDVAIQKARTSVFFSNDQLAMSARAVGFIAQRFFPPGIDGTQPGPLFGFQEAVSLKLRPVSEDPTGTAPFPGNPNLPNGITIFPGGFPLYRDGHLIGAIGVSGDGVDQDDIITASGTEDFLAPLNIRSDMYSYRGARLPYAKFPKDPEQ